MNQPRSMSDEWIRRHGGFIRSIAASILREEGARDDAVQEAWVAALRRPPASGLQAWLRTVAGRMAGHGRREAARRRRREEIAARPEALPSAASVVERAEILRIVGELVAGLREPYREALLLRYYEALPPREIAARLDVPVATVDSRIQRGLRQVRADLERRTRGEARHWTQTLALALGLDPPSHMAPVSPNLTLLGALSMKTKTGLMLGATVLVAATTLVVRNGLGERRAAEARGDELARLEVDRPEPPVAKALTSTPASRESVAITPSPPKETPSGLLSGAVLDPTGRGVGLARVLAGPHPRDLRTVGTADEQGYFALALEPSDRVVGARAAGWAPSPLATVPETEDAEELTLFLPVLGARFEVSVVDPGGAALPGAQVFVGRETEREHRLPDGSSARTVPSFLETTDGIGVARFEGLAPGWQRVGVRHPDFAPSAAFATLRRGELNAVEVRLAEGFFVEGIVRDAAGRPIPGAVLRRGSSDARTAESDSAGAFRFGPIDHGKVVVTGPFGRRAEERLGAEPGETVHWDPVLTDDATIRGRVLAASGKGHPDAWVTANLDTWPGWSRGARTDAEGRFAIHGCPEQPVRLEVRARREETLPHVVLHGLRPGPDEVRIELAEVEGFDVSGWLAFPEEGERPELFLRHETTPQRQRLTGGPGVRLEPDENGTFQVSRVPPGRYRIVATGPPVGWALLASFELAGSDVELGTLEVPIPGSVSTTLLRPAGLPEATASFLLERPGDLVTLFQIEGEPPSELSLAPGSYVLRVEVTPGPRRDYPFQVRSGRVTNLELALSSTCRHRVRVRYASGRVPAGTAALRVRQLDVERTVADTKLTRIEGIDWVLDLELESGRFEFEVRGPDGLEKRQIENLYSSEPGRAVFLVIDD